LGSGNVEQIVDLLVVNLEEGYEDTEVTRGLGLLDTVDSVEELVHTSLRDSHAFPVITIRDLFLLLRVDTSSIASFHRVSLSTSSLAVCEYSSMVAIYYSVDQFGNAKTFVHLLLVSVLRKHLVELERACTLALVASIRII